MTNHKAYLVKLLLTARAGPIFLYTFLKKESNSIDTEGAIAFFSERHDLLLLALKKLCSASVQDLVAWGLCSEKIAQSIIAQMHSAQESADRELALAEREGISLCSIFDDDYPLLLRSTYAPPYLVYCQGSLPHQRQKQIALVGARAATSYAQSVIKSLVPRLIDYGWSIVSGGAWGVDSWAHQQALDSGGTTIVVQGAGLLKLYPAANRQLFKDVVAHGGALISCFPLTMAPTLTTFPARNRIIAGMSSATIVVQAGVKSGALITAAYALDANRLVGAVPGMIHEPLSEGCHKLIKQGAFLVTTPDDLLQELGEVVGGISPADSHAKNDQEALFVDGHQGRAVNRGGHDALIDFIRVSARSDEEIAFFLNKELCVVQAMLFDLYIEGVLKQTFAGMWILARS